MNALLTVAEAAERMSVSRQRMHKLIETYNIETSTVKGKLLVLHEAELKKIPKVRKNNSAAKKASVKLDSMITTSQSIELEKLRKLTREYQERTGVTLTQLAQEAGLSRALVYRVINGSYESSPSFEFVCKLCSVMGVSLEFSTKSPV